MRLFKHKRSSNHKLWKVAGGAALVALAAGVIANFRDIKRYLKISAM